MQALRYILAFGLLASAAGAVAASEKTPPQPPGAAAGRPRLNRFTGEHKDKVTSARAGEIR